MRCRKFILPMWSRFHQSYLYYNKPFGPPFFLEFFFQGFFFFFFKFYSRLPSFHVGTESDSYFSVTLAFGFICNVFRLQLIAILHPPFSIVSSEILPRMPASTLGSALSNGAFTIFHHQPDSPTEQSPCSIFLSFRLNTFWQILHLNHFPRATYDTVSQISL